MMCHRHVTFLQSTLQRSFLSITCHNYTNKSRYSSRSLLPRRHILFGSNTNVGKTIVSAGLVRATMPGSCYIKPLQCGGSDQEFIERYSSIQRAHTLFQWDTPASPHDACRIEQLPVSERQVLDAIQSTLDTMTLSLNGSPTWIETAGGVLSPSSSSPQNNSSHHAICSKSGWGWMSQADLYRSLIGTCSTILVGDGRLGGISATLSSLESLLIRGYQVVGLILIETPPQDNLTAIRNYIACQENFQPTIDQAIFHNVERSIVALPPLPPPSENLYKWYDSDIVHDTFVDFNQHLEDSWNTTFDD
jgi:dethiobiotin synthetase